MPHLEEGVAQRVPSGDADHAATTHTATTVMVALVTPLPRETYSSFQSIGLSPQAGRGRNRRPRFQPSNRSASLLRAPSLRFSGLSRAIARAANAEP